MYNNNLTPSGVKNSNGQLTIESLASQVKQLQERVVFLESVIIGSRIPRPHKKKNISSNFVLTTEQQRLFDRAVSAGLMERLHDGRYHWLASKALLAYFCGRVFCGDYAKDGIWQCGKGRFPEKAAEQLMEFYNGMLRDFPNLCSMPEPLTYQQFKDLILQYHQSNVMFVMRQLDNYRSLSKYISAKRTLNNWLQIHIDKKENRP